MVPTKHQDRSSALPVRCEKQQHWRERIIAASDLVELKATSTSLFSEEIYGKKTVIAVMRQAPNEDFRGSMAERQNEAVRDRFSSFHWAIKKIYDTAEK